MKEILGHIILLLNQLVLGEATCLACFLTVCLGVSRMMDVEMHPRLNASSCGRTQTGPGAVFQGYDGSGGLKETTGLSHTG